MNATLLDPLAFPLQGSRLVEASAGTGKTYTIAALYLRLVLGHGGAAAFARALTPPEVLVVTFTDAATQELRDRIRARLAEAATAFLADPATVAPQARGEDLLHELRASYPPEQWPACARALRLAAEWMDEAAVSTIHGWCNRMLSEHAFASGSLFTQRLETDTGDLKLEVMRDYWRIHFNLLLQADAETVRGWWKEPEALLAALKNLIKHSDALSAAAPPAESLAQARTQSQAQLDALKAPWRGDQGWAEELLHLFEAACAAKQIKLPKRKDWMAAVRAWAEGDAVQPKLTDTAWKQLSPEGIASKDGRPGAELLAHPALVALGELRDALAALPDGKLDVLSHATHWLTQRFAAEQQARAQMGYDEMLTGLDTALAGPRGGELAALIRRQFPVALIDEFQDTDPLQYRIFDAIYGVAANRGDTALILIGDPKQAIYAFRGADIYTYLAARHATAGRHATLGTNFRASTGMVAAVNHVFEQAERPPGGAFGIEQQGRPALPFQPVTAHGRKESWEDPAGGGRALTFWRLSADSKTAAETELAAACASEIVRLLADPDAGFRRPTGELRRVVSSDIAVLVNKGKEADLVRAALRQRGVRSVYLSDRESVIESPLAADLQRWLAACAEPDAERRVRAALATATLALSWQQLEKLRSDELAWEREVLRFRAYRDTWRRQGVLPMLRHLIHDFHVPARLLAAGDERSLTDLLHLAEWLQAASSTVVGEHALLRHLAQARADDNKEADARRVRLESDEALVKVVTVHKSKGLEYPLVFLPFATHYRAVDGKYLPVVWHDKAGAQHIELNPDAQAIAAADTERRGEDLRKLYVALTRARHATWVGAAEISKSPDSALAALSTSADPAATQPSLAQALVAWATDCEHIAALDLPAASDAVWSPPAAPAQVPLVLAMPARRAPWWIASYSRLRVADRGQAAPASAAEDIYAESVLAAEAGVAPAAPELAAGVGLGSLHAFHRGARPGSLLHALLEWTGRRGFVAALDPGSDDRDDYVARRCKLAGWPQWIAPLRAWLARWTTTPLKLDALVPGIAPVAPAGFKYTQVEMEFWFAASGVDTLQLDALVRAHTLGGAARPALAAETVNGMFKGYIDLVFEHEGRYFVADYKSNHLGADDAAYTPAALRDAVLDHRYDLQTAIYLLALHRLLKQRLPDYDYERHVGGAIILFLRGQDAPSQGLHGERPPRALIEALDQIFSGAAARPST